MKKLLFLSIFAFCAAAALHAQTQFAFGIKPGLEMNSAWIGIKQNRILPYLGADLMWLSFDGSYEKVYEKYETQTTYLKEYTSVDFSGKAFLLVPHLGLKFFLLQKPIQPYIFTGMFVGLPIVDLNATGTQTTRNYDEGNFVEEKNSGFLPNLPEIESTVQEALGFWGVSFGGGAEYYFSDNFSVGGEYGFRLLFDTATHQSMTGDIDLKTMIGEGRREEADVSASLKLSYAVVTVNFYF